MKKTTDKQSLDSGGPETDAGRSDSQLSRRRFTGKGLAAPVILSLASRPAFGAVCSPSGFVSHSPNSPSGVNHTEAGCGGLSPGAYMNPNSNGDGSRGDWLPYFPNPRQDGNSGPGMSGLRHASMGYDDPPGTPFKEVFDVQIFNANGDPATLHDVLLENNGSLEWHVVAALLNSKNVPGYMPTEDVIGLYKAAITGGSWTTQNGAVVSMTEYELKTFIEQTYH